MTGTEMEPDAALPRAGFRVRCYRPGDEDGILALFGRAFPGAQRGLATWRWLFRDCPQGARITVAEAADGGIVAHYAAIPLRLWCRGEERPVGHYVDSMVDPRWRRLGRRGPFLATASAYFRWFGDPAPNHLNYGFPNPQALRLGVRHLAYEVVHQRFPTLFYNGFEERPLRRLNSRGADCSARPVARFGHRHAGLWERLRPSIGLALCRDPAYLNWRYVDAPLRYECREILDRTGAVRGLFVLRHGWAGQPITALVDLLVAPTDVDALACALRCALGPVRDRVAARLELWLPPGSPWFCHALELGLQAETSLFTMVCSLPRTPDQLGWHRANWYFTIGDSDVF
jgi:hypothetical protein